MTKAKNPPQTDVSAPAVHVQTKAKFVTVASKMPMHITLTLDAPVQKMVPGRFGSEKETSFVPGEAHVIRGTAYPSGQVPKGFFRPPQLIEDEHGGYAMTPNIPAAFWFEWLKQHKDTDMVRNGMIKAQVDLDSLAADAAEHAKIDSGLGPIVPGEDEKGRPLDRRAPRPMNVSVSDVKQEPRVAA